MNSSCGFCKVDSAELKSCACKKVSYCGEDCQKADWKNHKPSCPLYIIREAPGKRLGVFATRKIRNGEIIMEELPILLLRDGLSGNEFMTDHFPNISEETKSKIFKLRDPADNIIALNSEQYELWKSTNSADLIWDLLSNCDDVSRILRIFRDNFFPICNGPEQGLYYEMSYINHGCIPNSWVKSDLQRKKVCALGTIEKDEEILINYRKGEGEEFNYGSRDYRRQRLLRTNGFLCQCFECSLEGEALEDNERMRAEVLRRWRDEERGDHRSID